MQFYESSRFIFLWLIPVAVVIWKWGSRERRNRLNRWGDAAFLEKQLMPGFSSARLRWGWGLLAGVFFLSTLALARPQWGEEKKKVERKGVDLVFLLDTSLSMLAEDVKPNRLGKSKLEIKNLLRHLKGDRVGMVGFAGSSFLQCPLTLDYSAFLLFVDALKPGYIPIPGTSLAEAIRLGIRAFPEESRKYRALLVFSDGEDHEGGMEEALAEAKKAGVRIYAIGTGTSEGAPIPLHSGTNPKVTTGYKKDRDGQVVITRLNAPLLEKIAKETGGLYLSATPGEREVDLILKHLETLGEHRLREKLITEKEDHFQLFLFLAFLLLMGESTFRHPRKRTPALKGLLLVAGLILLSGFFDSPRSLVQKGNELSKEKKYQSAVENYRKAEVRRPDEPVIRYNLGTTLYQLYAYRDADKELEEALSRAKDPTTKAQILYNYGNTKYRLGDFEKAIDSYKKALEINPKDEDAKYNLEFLQKKKSLFDKKQEQKQNQKKQNEQQQPQPQNNQQQSPNNKQQQNQQQNQQQQQQPQQKQNQQQEQPSSQGGQENSNQQLNQQNQEQPKQDQGQQQKQEEEQKQNQGQGQEQGSQGEQKKNQGQNPDQGQEKEDQEQQQPHPAKPLEQGSQSEQPGPEQPSPQMGDQEKGQAPSQPGPQGTPLQGQMTQENARQILDILKEGEKQLQDVRRPPAPPETREVTKDW